MSINRAMDKDVVHIYNGILLSHKKKSKVMPFAATCMDLEIVLLSEIKSDTGRHISHSITYTWNLKNPN